MIRQTWGDILTADVDAVVNPVNTVGVMGAGLAKQFGLAYPAMFDDYVGACRRTWPGKRGGHRTGTPVTV
jgi:O-acetyl-ADP-ribose deacetylase (regulator of RNase III)